VSHAHILQAYDVVFYGDSITEEYLGTNVGTPVSRADGSPAVFARHFSKYATAILAAGGDRPSTSGMHQGL
jgi:hypothetical protein